MEKKMHLKFIMRWQADKADKQGNVAPTGNS